MSRQVVATVRQIERALIGTKLNKEEFLHRLVQIKDSEETNLADSYIVGTNKLKHFSRGDLIEKNKRSKMAPIWYYKKNGIGRIPSGVILRNPKWFYKNDR